MPLKGVPLNGVATVLKFALIYPQVAQKCKTSKAGQTNQPTNRPTDRHSDLKSRVHATKKP